MLGLIKKMRIVRRQTKLTSQLVMHRLMHVSNETCVQFATAAQKIKKLKLKIGAVDSVHCCGHYERQSATRISTVSGLRA